MSNDSTRKLPQSPIPSNAKRQALEQAKKKLQPELLPGEKITLQVCASFRILLVVPIVDVG